ncbi:MAG: type II toxin-antitoxin system RelE/ParE family toxin [Candidatus Altiarchaeota archaeon]
MPLYNILFHRSVKKYVDKLDSITKSRLRKAVDELAENPIPPASIKVEGYRDQKIRRLRVGDHRILYVVDLQEKEVIIVKIDKRGRVYKR